MITDPESVAREREETLTLLTRLGRRLGHQVVGRTGRSPRGVDVAWKEEQTLSCLFAGWLGGFYAHYYGILTPDVLHTKHTVEVLAVAYIGGRGSIWGGALTAFPFIFIIEWLRSSLTELPGLHLVIYGLVLILVMIFYPGGIAQLYSTAVTWLKGMRESRSRES